jgi:hypothetical protein
MPADVREESGLTGRTHAPGCTGLKLHEDCGIAGNPKLWFAHGNRSTGLNGEDMTQHSKVGGFLLRHDVISRCVLQEEVLVESMKADSL